MTAATLLALAAGAPAALGIADLAAAVHARPRGPARRAARLRAALLALGRRIGAPPAPRDLAHRLDAAGAPLTPSDAMALKAGAALAALLAALPFAAGAPGRLGPVLPLAGAAAGFLALDGVLIVRTRRRAAAMAVELPDILDLLRVVLDAGLPPGRALAEVGRRHGGMLAAELRRAAARTAVGVTTHDVLRALRRRAPVDGVGALVTVLERAERLGTPPGEALAALARDAREARASRRAEAAAKAAPKIQLIVALLLVPSVMLLVAAALAPALLAGVSGG
jgi:tight adherence protein C